MQHLNNWLTFTQSSLVKSLFISLSLRSKYSITCFTLVTSFSVALLIKVAVRFVILIFRSVNILPSAGMSLICIGLVTIPPGGFGVHASLGRSGKWTLFGFVTPSDRPPRCDFSRIEGVLWVAGAGVRWALGAGVLVGAFGVWFDSNIWT